DIAGTIVQVLASVPSRINCFREAIAYIIGVLYLMPLSIRLRGTLVSIIVGKHPNMTCRISGAHKPIRSIVLIERSITKGIPLANFPPGLVIAEGYRAGISSAIRFQLAVHASLGQVDR